MEIVVYTKRDTNGQGQKAECQQRQSAKLRLSQAPKTEQAINLSQAQRERRPQTHPTWRLVCGLSGSLLIGRLENRPWSLPATDRAGAGKLNPV